MRKLMWSILAFTLPAMAGEVFEAHDKWPSREAQRDAAPQQASVPEPATAPLLVLGLGVLYIATRRKKP